MLNERSQSPKTRNYRTHLFTCPEYTSLETEVNLVLPRARGDGELSSHSYEVWRFLGGNVLRLASGVAVHTYNPSLRSESRRTRNSRSYSAAQQTQGHLGLQESLSLGNKARTEMYGNRLCSELYLASYIKILHLGSETGTRGGTKRPQSDVRNRGMTSTLAQKHSEILSRPYRS